MGTINLVPPTAGTPAVAGTFSTAFTTLQTWANGNVDTVNISSTAAIKGSQLATGLTGPPGAELAYNEFTSNVNCTATTEATATTIVTASAVAFDGSTAAMIEFFSPNFDAGDAPNFSLYLYDGSSSIGFMHTRTVAASTAMGAIRIARRLTPSNASHTYSIRGTVSSGGGVSVKGGAGGVGVNVPGFIRITKV
jgi:hypothetical protein